jgi:hypothetical protein
MLTLVTKKGPLSINTVFTPFYKKTLCPLCALCETKKRYILRVKQKNSVSSVRSV